MRKALWAALAALSICGSMAAQGTRFSGPVIKTTAAIPGATVRVCTETATGTPCAPLASIYSDKALTVLDADSIITADSAGNYGFYAAGGCYKIQTSASGYTTVTDIVCNGTAAGNISVTSISAPQTGNTAPVQIGGVWYPGTASGTALAPTATPSTSVTLSGGSIADGTYYCKVTYVNDNGQTTPSPAATITVSGGGGAARVTCAQNDRLWLSGAYGLRVYFSNDNVNFYLQTPPVSTQDFMIDTTTHYVQISAGFYYTSLTFSGTQPPATNTATIDPLQVALNATMRQSDYAVQFGELYVPPIFNSSGAVTAYVLTTPLIVGRNAKIKGVMHWGEGQNAAGSSIYMTSTHAKKAVIMSFGGFVTIENISVLGVGHAVMFLASSGYQGGHTVVKNCYFKTSDTTNTYAALVFVGPYQYDHHFENVSMRGGKTVIQYKNAAGGLHYFSNARWDAGGNSMIQSIPGWSDPDNGVQLPTQGFGVGGIRLTNIRTEGGTGILFDCVGLGIYFDRVEIADTLVVAGTEANAKFGTDATYGGISFLSLKDTGFPPTNALTGTKWVGAAGTLEMSGNSSLGWGGNTGSQVALDVNNVAGMFISDFSNNSNANWGGGAGATNTDGKVINVPANTRIQALNSGHEIVSGTKWQEIGGGLAFVPRVASAWERDRAWRIYNPGSGGLARQFVLEAGSFYSNATLLSINQSTKAATFYGAVSPSAPAIAHGDATNYWAYNGTIGATTPRSGAFTTGSFTGQITSTLATGTAPFSIASTTVVPNLNVSQLLGKTWAIPDPIGSTTPAAITGTTLTANTSTTSPLYNTTTNCSSSASPAVCAAAPSGSVVIAAAATTVTVNTTAVTANSQILVFEDSSLGTKLSVTCNTTTGRTYTVTARTAATSFVITASAAPATNPACLSYKVEN